MEIWILIKKFIIWKRVKLKIKLNYWTLITKIKFNRKIKFLRKIILIKPGIKGIRNNLWKKWKRKIEIINFLIIIILIAVTN